MLELVTGAFVAIAAVGLVLEPLLRGAPHAFSPAPTAQNPDLELTDLSESSSPKVQALLALKEIEFDRATGKLSDEDYRSLKQRYAREAVTAIGAEAGEEAVSPSDEGGDAAEAAVTRLKTRQSAACATCGVPAEPGAAFCSRCGRMLSKDGAPPRCWMCGADLVSEAKFCGACGFALSA